MLRLEQARALFNARFPDRKKSQTDVATAMFPKSTAQSAKQQYSHLKSGKRDKVAVEAVVAAANELDIDYNFLFNHESEYDDLYKKLIVEVEEEVPK